jgi:RimJ/RimL family protein N-acetyltransferase
MPGDSPFMHQLMNTAGWLDMMGGPNLYSEAEATAYIQRILERPATHYWAVRLRSTDTTIGIVTFMKRDNLEYPDIGCAFLPQHANSGYAYESMKAVLYHVIRAGGYTHVSGITPANNARSIKLLKKLGLKFRKEIGEKSENSHLYEASTDRIFIAEATRSFFSAFTNKGNNVPDLHVLKDICIPEVLLINRRQSNTEVFDLPSFVESTKKILIDGSLLEFEEKEIFEETKIAHGIATRLSQYEKEGIVYKQKFKMKGHRFFQFLKLKQSWKISSILWEDNEI